MTGPSVRQQWYRRVQAIVVGIALFLVVRLPVVYQATTRASEPVSSQLGYLDGSSPMDSVRSIALIFQPEDCPGALQVIRELDGLWRAGEDVRGFTVTALDSGEVSELQAAHSIDFPVSGNRSTQARIVLSRFGYTQTPLIILMGAAGEVRSVLDSRAFPTLDRLVAQAPSAASHVAAAPQ